MNIQVGDRVSWQQRTPTRPYLHRMAGTVLFVRGDFAYVDTGVAFAGYHVDLRSLTKLGPIEAAVDDYTFAVGQAGNLGGVQLD